MKKFSYVYEKTHKKRKKTKDDAFIKEVYLTLPKKL